MQKLMLFYSGQYYTDDQLLNIYTFSMLYQWISKTQHHLTYQREGSEPRPINLSGTRSDSPSASLVSSFDKLGQSTSSDKLSQSPSSVPKFGRTPSAEKLSSSPAKRQSSPAQLGSLPAHSGSSPSQRGSSNARPVSLPAQPGSSNASPSRSRAGSQDSQKGETSPLKSGSQSRIKTPVFEQKSVPFDRKGSMVPTIDRRGSVIPTFDRRGSTFPKTIFDALVGRSMDYCFRILDQCERSK